MSKDLVALLRRPYGNLTFGEKQQVADLIEELEAKLAKAVEESDARETRSRRWREDLERWLEESETREAALNDRITMLEEHLCLTEEKLAEAVEGLLKISFHKNLGQTEPSHVAIIARSTLAALETPHD